MKSPLAFLSGVLIAASLGALGLAWPLSSSIDIELRDVPRRTQAGRLQRAVPLGQGFRCEFDGLRRIEVALVPLGPTQGASLELSLRGESPDGPLLQRVAASELPCDSGWGVFEFEPILDSAGRDFWWQLELPAGARQSAYSPWIRYHGHVGINTGWGDRILKGPLFEGSLADGLPGSYPRVPHPFLSAVCFAAENLVPASGPIRLELWGAQQAAFEGAPLRSVTLGKHDEIHGGYAFFAFEPIVQSRWQDISYRLTLNGGARLVGSAQGPSRMTWHGKGESKDRLLGHSRAGQIYTDRSLLFRAHSNPGFFERIGQISRRGGSKLWIGGLCWLLAAGFLTRALFVR